MAPVAVGKRNERPALSLKGKATATISNGVFAMASALTRFRDDLQDDVQDQIARLSREVASLRKTMTKRGGAAYEDARDAAGDLYDGTKMVGLEGLNAALVKHQDTILRVFTENLMAYALGRRVEYYDMPTVRSIIRNAGQHGNHISAYIVGVVNSPAFRMSRAESTTTTAARQDQ